MPSDADDPAHAARRLADRSASKDSRRPMPSPAPSNRFNRWLSSPAGQLVVATFALLHGGLLTLEHTSTYERVMGPVWLVLGVATLVQAVRLRRRGRRVRDR